MPIQLQVSGSESLRRKLEQLSESVRGRLNEMAVVAGALIVQNDAKRRAPYRTGNLRRSIHIGGHADVAADFHDTTGTELPAPETSATRTEVLIGTNVEYAWFIEYGIQRRRPRPYLRPALDENQDAVQREVGEAYRDLIRKAV